MLNLLCFNAFFAAQKRFDTVLGSLVEELDDLRQPMTAETPVPEGAVAKRMHEAVLPFCSSFLTRMICVAGAVADETLEAITQITPLERAYVNNGGDIALYLSPGATFDTAIMSHDNQILSMLRLGYDDGVGGIATSGRHGRSQSLGIADAVTVLAHDAATADVAATLIANAVDLPGHSVIRRQPATRINPDSDLGGQLIVADCGPLTETEKGMALDRGLAVAPGMIDNGQIIGVAMFLQGRNRTLGPAYFPAVMPERTIQHA